MVLRCSNNIIEHESDNEQTEMTYHSFVAATRGKNVVFMQIGRVSATDKDGDRYNGFAYRLQSTSANDSFSVDSETGEITARTSLDREARSLHRFNVVAFDRRQPAMSSTAVVTVQVLPFDLHVSSSSRQRWVRGQHVQGQGQ